MGVYLDPERAGTYIREARRAFALIALAHLEKMRESGARDAFILRRLAVLGELIKA